MHLQREFSMALSPAGYKRYVTGEDCRVVATTAIRDLLEKTMEWELKDRLEEYKTVHGEQSDRRNGYYERTLVTSHGYVTGIRVPRARVSSVAGTVIPAYGRRQTEFDAAVLSSFLHGHSTRKSARFFKDLYREMGVSHTTVSRIIGRLDELCKVWRRRPLDRPYVYLWLDGKYAKIRNATRKPYAVLFAYGACEDGHRELLGFQIHRSEGTANWECMLLDLVNRGLDPQRLRLVIRDENSGCEQAILTQFGDVPQQSCAVHLERNLGKLVKKHNKGEFCSDVSEIFKQKSLSAARTEYKAVLENWGRAEAQACLYLQGNVDKSLVFHEVADAAVWRTHLKSTNMLERFFRELKRFEKGRQFRYANEASCMRFYYAYAKCYNDDHPQMPKPSKKKWKPKKVASHLTGDMRGSRTKHPRKTTGIQAPPKKRHNSTATRREPVNL